jgi:hypothetical protein
MRSVRNRSGVIGHKIADVISRLEFDSVEKGLTYYFVVTAVNSDGDSNESEELPYAAIDE